MAPFVLPHPHSACAPWLLVWIPPCSILQVRCDSFPPAEPIFDVLSDGALLLQLSEVRPLGKRPESVLDPFALTFRAGAWLQRAGDFKCGTQLGEMDTYRPERAEKNGHRPNMLTSTCVARNSSANSQFYPSLHHI